MLTGHATAEATARFGARFRSATDNGFYRQAAGRVTVSSLGIGTYLGAFDDAADAGYEEAICTAIEAGINVIDTSLNYRHQRSERCAGSAIAKACASDGIDRSEIVVCTKGGFLTPGAVPFDVLDPADIVGNVHCLSPAFLSDQIERSRRNLGIETIDVYYVHNPETQLDSIPQDVVYERMLAAFEELERAAEENKIGAYGVATWTAFRQDHKTGKALSLGRLIEIARQAGGAEHHFRCIQLPVNLAMHEATAMKFEEIDRTPVSVLELASRSGMVAVASATLLQARLSQDLPDAVAGLTPGARTDAQRAIQFTRSTPGIDVALVGMSRPEHVTENAEVRNFPPLDVDEYRRFYP